MPNIELTDTLELFDKYFKAVVIKTLQWTIMNRLKTNKVVSLSKDIKDIKNQMEILGVKNIMIKI